MRKGYGSVLCHNRVDHARGMRTHMSETGVLPYAQRGLPSCTRVLPALQSSCMRLYACEKPCNAYVSVEEALVCA